MRTWASNFWALGGDGVYVYNYDLELTPDAEVYAEKVACLSQMGSPDTLLGLDKAYQPDTGCSIPYCGHINLPG